ncbi:hypothetical protein NPA31_018865 [Aurantimonas sp. MSK8Z-1]|uniref:hypothetical protein n=1 Tax=Mangrovibrevibacter kandeliae TaxID=2968473 RepID=UPI002119213D|nr:hypothetical protein [Aurantimonas sp. MSK8Z-1]MCW4117026.1 hypothetical protein [Aurantimonas sp. MSK8Z-1]
MPEMRVVDRTLVEALGAHLVSLPPDVTATIAPALIALTVAGLEYAGYDKRTAERAVGKRLRYWMSSKPRGIVKAAKDRASVIRKDLTP